MFFKHVYVKNVGVTKKLWKMIKVALSNKNLNTNNTIDKHMRNGRTNFYNTF